MEAANLERPLLSRSDLQALTVSGILLQNEMRMAPDDFLSIKYLGQYVRANNAASGIRCVFASRSTHALASPSWNRVAKARLF